jgi:transposase
LAQGVRQRGMPARYVTVDRETPMLLPPDLRDWVPADHLVHFVIDALGELDVRMARVNEQGSGSEQYPPAMMLGLLIYSYATGVFGSRRIEQTTYENVAVRLLCGDTHPDHDTICTFRRQNRELLSRSFAQVLELAARCRVLKVGDITVAIDGTKVLANASRHSAVSYGRAGEQLRQVELEIEQLLAQAEADDAQPLQDGLSLEGELARRHERKARLQQARAEIEARAFARAQPERARKAPDQPGPPAPPTPAATDQYNCTDPQSRIMPAGGKTRFDQSDNAQAAVEVESRLIVGQRVCQAANDKEPLVPTLASVAAAAGSVKEVLTDSGFCSEAAVGQIEHNDEGQPTGITVLAAVGRKAHGRTVADLEQRADPPAPPAPAPFTERMAYRTATAAGRARYQLRQQTVEPIFGIIKAAIGFRRFMLRGLETVSLEWTLVTLSYNLRRLHTLGAVLKAA